MPTDTDILFNAKAMLFRTGWCKNAATRPTGEMCLGYALRQASLLAMADEGRGERIVEAVLGIVPGGIPNWNDDARRTFEDVISALDKALLFVSLGWSIRVERAYSDGRVSLVPPTQGSEGVVDRQETRALVPV